MSCAIALPRPGMSCSCVSSALTLRFSPASSSAIRAEKVVEGEGRLDGRRAHPLHVLALLLLPGLIQLHRPPHLREQGERGAIGEGEPQVILFRPLCVRRMIAQPAAAFSQQQDITWLQRDEEPAAPRMRLADHLPRSQPGELLVGAVVPDELVGRVALGSAADSLAGHRFVELAGQGDVFGQLEHANLLFLGTNAQHFTALTHAKTQRRSRSSSRS